MSHVLQHRPALGQRSPIQHPGIALEALPEGHVLHLLAAPEVDAGALQNAACRPLRPVSPGQWFLVGDEVLTPQALADLEARVKPLADLVDQGHGRVRIALSGPRARDVLAKGTAVDLGDPAFPIGHATPTLIGHIGVHLTRTDEDRFELLVLRGFAQNLWDELALMAAEYA
ncbi:hypothetical protein BJF93_02185 [Xaviernesmea oryzae]|uniref:GCVT N-terminal domain-containing protein n=1 Tax=Xaviernesmea oryzae TaxID=464029 RepID=A0A1Q9AZ04_9HYPH|nr:sarcosine oxidase subunit gamma family protein [Xaviernesmea oryzae]OLP60904.1 hypothetical protein BJF93_02185 [Xaviernesmea oryzae]SEL22210.1 sarcosine oxidase subunit gamma [Xaviernesmea oryzae]